MAKEKNINGNDPAEKSAGTPEQGNAQDPKGNENTQDQKDSGNKDSGAEEEKEQAQKIDVDAIKAELKAEILAEMKTKDKAQAKSKAVQAEPAKEETSGGISVDHDAIAAREEEYVEMTLFYDGDKYAGDVIIEVNDEKVQIQRGKPVKVKRKFATLYQNSMRQKGEAAAIINEFEKNYQQKSNVLG